MPKLRTLSGPDLLKIFAKFGFERIDQAGSHVKIRRQLLAGSRQSLTIPLHDEIDVLQCEPRSRRTKPSAGGSAQLSRTGSLEARDGALPHTLPRGDASPEPP